MAIELVKRFRGIDRGNLIQANRGLIRLVRHNNRQVFKHGLGGAIFSAPELATINAFAVQLQAWLAEKRVIIR